MNKVFGCSSNVGQIKKILLKHPRDAFINQDWIDLQWKGLNYPGRPDYGKVLLEYEYFFQLLKKHIPEIFFLPISSKTGLDSIYTHDPVIMTPCGAILGNMGKSQRKHEPQAVHEYLEQNRIPVIGSITGNGLLEGGDAVIFNEKTMAIALGYRTNAEGIKQFKSITKSFIKEVVVVPLPHWNGPSDVLHLMSFISPIDYNLAVVYSRIMPVTFRQWLLKKGIRLIEVPDHEYLTMACNILPVSPRVCIMIQGNPETKKKLEAEGIQVEEFSGEEICKKGGGGPTCLTRPLLRLDRAEIKK